MEKKAKHPLQPLELDEHRVLRFKKNKIVEYLLDNGGLDLNKLASINFSSDDRSQFLQLIGYSHGGHPYLSKEDYDASLAAYEKGQDPIEAARDSLREQLVDVKRKIRDGIAQLYDICPEDLNDE